jgi:hypothetical protein
MTLWEIIITPVVVGVALLRTRHRAENWLICGAHLSSA